MASWKQPALPDCGPTLFRTTKPWMNFWKVRAVHRAQIAGGVVAAADHPVVGLVGDAAPGIVVGDGDAAVAGERRGADARPTRCRCPARRSSSIPEPAPQVDRRRRRSPSSRSTSPAAPRDDRRTRCHRRPPRASGPGSRRRWAGSANAGANTGSPRSARDGDVGRRIGDGRCRFDLRDRVGVGRQLAAAESGGVQRAVARAHRQQQQRPLADRERAPGRECRGRCSPTRPPSCLRTRRSAVPRPRM